MKINKYIDKKINELLDKFIKDENMAASDIVFVLQEESEGITGFFHFLLDLFICKTFDRGYIILSPGLYKFYIRSKHKSSKDLVFTKPDEQIDLLHPIEYDEIVEIDGKQIGLVRGVFTKILKELGLKKTMNAFIKSDVISTYWQQDEFKGGRVGVYDSFIHTMYKEFNKKKKTLKKRYIKFDPAKYYKMPSNIIS